MTRLLLFALLGLSLAGNAWLVLSPRAGQSAAPSSPTAPLGGTGPSSARSAAAAPAPAAAPQAASAVSADPDAPRGLTWRSPTSDEDFRRLAADLRAAGFPSRVIAAVVRDLYESALVARSPLATAHYWQRRGIESSKEMQEHYRGLTAKLSDLLGPDGKTSAMLDPVARKRQYGSLPDAKIDAIAAIERDYQDMTTDVYRSTESKGFSEDSFRNQREQTKLLDTEKLADLAKILTPAELTEYQLHNSSAARTVARTVGEFELTPEQFATLVAARQQFDAASPEMTGAFSMEMQQQRQAAQNAYFEAARATLAPADFYKFMENSDSSYRQLAQLRTQFPSVTGAGAYEAWTLQNEFRNTAMNFRNTRPTPEQITKFYADLNARLDRALGADAAAAFRQTNAGRMFNAPQLRSSSGAPATPTTPRN